MGKVIFNSDDFGYSHGVNYGIADAYQRGILTSTTLMANMPGFDHAVKLKRDLPNLGVGVHLTLTCGKPLLKNVTSLMDGDNFKHLSFYTQPFEVDGDQLYQEGLSSGNYSNAFRQSSSCTYIWNESGSGHCIGQKI